jgi:hypothetical protein
MSISFFFSFIRKVDEAMEHHICNYVGKRILRGKELFTGGNTSFFLEKYFLRVGVLLGKDNCFYIKMLPSLRVV